MAHCVFIVEYVITNSLRIVICKCRKDVRLPVHLQRAMATEAEAQREARAQVHNYAVLPSVTQVVSVDTVPSYPVLSPAFFTVLILFLSLPICESSTLGQTPFSYKLKSTYNVLRSSADIKTVTNSEMLRA